MLRRQKMFWGALAAHNLRGSTSRRSWLPQMRSKRSADAKRCTNRLPVPMPGRGAFRRIARQNRSEYSAEQLHAGMATPTGVPAGHARSSTRAHPARPHNPWHRRQGVLHLARRLLGTKIITLARTVNPFPAPHQATGTSTTQVRAAAQSRASLSASPWRRPWPPELVLRDLRSGLKARLRGALRLHRDQLLYGVHLAVDEEHVGDLDGCPAGARCRRP